MPKIIHLCLELSLKKGCTDIPEEEPTALFYLHHF